MKVFQNITDLIGRTPLLHLNRLFPGSHEVYGKLESFNPGSSVKDRAALGMIQDAEAKGMLKPGGAIIEATSGNTGIALSMIAAAKGYTCIIVMPDSMTTERRRIISAFGARVELTPAHLGMAGAIDKARMLHKSIAGSFLVGQFDNPANVKIHEETTAEEILDDLDGRVDAVIAGVGTGGTIIGIGKRIRKKSPQTQIVAVEPAASAVLSSKGCGPHAIQGIGPGFIPSIYDKTVVTQVVTVTDADAILWTRKAIRTEGLLIGLSSGAALCAANDFLITRKNKALRVVVILPDTGERYLSLSNLA